jgi:anti-sigma factor RsiW
MRTSHLTTWEQEEYVINRRAPQLLRHLAECAECRAAVARLEHGVGIFRHAAVEWSAQSLATRPQPWPTISSRRLPVHALRWAFAAVIPLLLLVLALRPFHVSSPRAAQPAAAISDDALLDQVDEQLSVAVPSSMESLTHLVSADSGTNSATAAYRRGSKPIVQTN